MRPSHTGLLLRFCWTEMRACRFFAISQLEPRIDTAAAPDTTVVPRRVFDIMHAEMLAVLTNQLFHVLFFPFRSSITYLIRNSKKVFNLLSYDSKKYFYIGSFIIDKCTYFLSKRTCGLRGRTAHKSGRTGMVLPLLRITPFPFSREQTTN